MALAGDGRGWPDPAIGAAYFVLRGFFLSIADAWQLVLTVSAR